MKVRWILVSALVASIASVAEAAGTQPVTWAGNWGGRFTHECRQVNGVPDPVVFTKSAGGHDCMVISAEMYIPGLTDADADPCLIRAEVETDISTNGGPLATPVTYPLVRDTRVGNNYRYLWDAGLFVARADRGDYHYRFRFSTDDGATWFTIGRSGGPDGGAYRSLLVRNDSQDLTFCGDTNNWEGPFNVFPACTDYLPAHQYNASYCELYVDGFGRGTFNHNQAFGEWLETYIRVREQDGDVLNVGMYVDAVEPDGLRTGSLSLAQEVQPGLWRTGYTVARRVFSPEGDEIIRSDVHSFAIFVDVLRPSGEVTRLWQSNGGANYTVDQLFSEPGYSQNIGSGSIEWVQEPSLIFSQKASCR